jgi:hypothetical protein
MQNTDAPFGMHKIGHFTFGNGVHIGAHNGQRQREFIQSIRNRSIYDASRFMMVVSWDQQHIIKGNGAY